MLLQSGDSLSSGEVAGGIYSADDGALLNNLTTSLYQRIPKERDYYLGEPPRWG